LKDEAFAERCRRLRLVLSDVDGVLTDGRLWLLPGGEEVKAFHVRDGLGIALAQKAGLRIGLISGRSSPAVEARARELGLAFLRQGVFDKAAVLREVLAAEQLSGREVAFMGDDVNDLAIMSEVALSAAPADAPFEVRAQAFMVTQAAGGQGCFREFLEAILRARGDWDRLLAT
jgi:3-deoxy-D-manno-octulosonate 8-phosphate phosphatase (KDO 8-P phosphatase)